MKIVKLDVGTVITAGDGHTKEDILVVKFEAEELARRIVHDSDQDGLRSVTETLYCTLDDRLIVYTEAWSEVSGGTSRYFLQEATSADVHPGGRFAALGKQAGISRSITLDEALKL